MPQTNLQNFAVDISPLLTALVKNNLVPANVSVGTVDFGTEAFHSFSNVTFSAADYSMDMCINGSCKISMASQRWVPGLSVVLSLGSALLLFLL